MKNQTIFLVAGMIISLACQLFTPLPTRDGTVMSNCAEIVGAVNNVQPGDAPGYMKETGIRKGSEFDANDYFTALTHLSMHEGYALDYVYQADFLGAFPMLYARPIDQEPYMSIADIPEGMTLPAYGDFLEIEEGEQGYFEAAVMRIMANQFYLVWHANYNDTQIVCDPAAAEEIVAHIDAGNFGMGMNAAQKAQVRGLRDVEPVVRLTGDSAIVEVVIFTKWGGFFRQTYTISRSFPHMIDVEEENLVEYDCGIMF